jgi:hypothetical protein
MQQIRCVDCEGFKPIDDPDLFLCGPRGNYVMDRVIADRDCVCLVASVRADLEEPTLEYECLANSRAG